MPAIGDPFAVLRYPNNPLLDIIHGGQIIERISTSYARTFAAALIRAADAADAP